MEPLRNLLQAGLSTPQPLDEAVNIRLAVRLMDLPYFDLTVEEGVVTGDYTPA